jgi:hypothetical protein
MKPFRRPVSSAARSSRSVRSAGSSFVAVALSLAACGGLNVSDPQGASRGCNVGGANEGVKQPGNAPGGVDLAYGDLAVSPDGSYVVYDKGERLAVVWTDTGLVQELPVRLPSRLGFAKSRHVVYVSSTFDGSLHAIDVASAETLWTTPLDEHTDGFLAVTRDDTRLAFAASDTLWVLDAGDGKVEHMLALERPPVDLEVLPDDRRIIVVESHEFEARAPNGTDAAASVSTRLDVLDLENGRARAVRVPNCSDDIVVTGDGARALLAPTTCAKDPISIIDLSDGNESFVKNLPGFGPVVIAPDGVTAVGFLDANQVDAALFEDPSAIPEKGAFHLMVIDSASLAYAFYEYGPWLPRYALTPNGRLLLVDDHGGSVPARLFDMDARTFEPIDGPSLRFEQVALASDSSHAYVLSNPALVGRARGRGRRGQVELALGYDLFELDLGEAKAAALAPGFRPRNVNIAPDDAALFLRRSATDVCVFSLATKSCERELVLSLGP